MSQDIHYRFAKGLERILELGNRDFPLIEIDSQSGVYTSAFLQGGFQVSVIEPFGVNPACDSDKCTVITKEIDHVIIPFRSVSVVWVAQALTFIKRDKVHRWLELSYDWLAKEGYLFCCFLEGEGHRIVTNQGAARIEQKVEYYYKPEEINAMFAFAGFTILDAWREGTPERPWIHLLAQKTNAL